MGVGCEGVRIVSIQGPLPSGLSALLQRTNPDLAAAVGQAPGVRFVQDPTHPLDERALIQADAVALDWLVEQGLLPQRPGYQILRTGQGGLTRTMPGFPEMAQISMDPDSEQAFGPALPVDPARDPVLFRWLTVFHETGHARLALETQSFRMPGWTAAQNTAMDRLMHGPSAYETRVSEVFAETYADTFAVLALTRLTGNSADARRAIRALRNARAEEPDATGVFDPHDTRRGLDRLLADLDEDPRRMAALLKATPEQLRGWTGAYASWGTVAWMKSPLGRRKADLAWATVNPGLVPDLKGSAAHVVEQAFAKVQADKLDRYVRARLAAYAWTDATHALRKPDPGQDPMLNALAQEDAAFAQVFQQTIGTDLPFLRRVLDAPPFGQDGNSLIQARFQKFPAVQAVVQRMVASAALYLDSPAHTQAIGQVGLAQYQQVTPSLAGAMPGDVDVWATAVPSPARPERPLLRRPAP
jgi:hypothetical protein